MKYRQLIFAMAGLLVLSGLPNTGRADATSATLYTSLLGGGGFHCHAVNVSQKTLTVTISFIDPDGNTLLNSGPQPTPPGAVAIGEFGTNTVFQDAYCQVQVSGTGNSNDLRIDLNTSFITTFNEGSQTNIPVFIARSIVGQ